MRTVLLLNVYKITGNEIGDLKKRNITNKHVLSILPAYCIRNDNYKIDYTESYLLWTEDGDDVFWLFDQIGADTILDEEISNCGLPEFFDGFDLSKIFEKISYNTYEDMGKRIPDTCHIIVDISYIGGYDPWSGDSDFDMELGIKFLTEAGIVDYLDLITEKIETEKNETIENPEKIDINDPEIKKMIEITKKQQLETLKLKKIDPNGGNLFVGI